MFIIGMIILIIVLLKENDKLKKEVNSLKMQLSNQQNNNVAPVRKFCIHCGAKLDYSKNIVICEKCGHNYSTNQNVLKKESVPQPNIVQQEKVTSNPKNIAETKNSLILVTGSILIVLSAILFLATTWNTSANYLKTLILVLMFAMFIIISKIAENIINLKKIANVFYNIALSYIPILLFSISLFGLLGEELSINGNARYIYLFLSSIVVTFIYYFDYKKRNSVFIGVGSHIFESLAFMLGVLIFTNDINIMLVGLSLNVLFNIFVINNKDTSPMSTTYNKFLFIAVSIVLVVLNLSKVVLGELTITSLILFIIYLVTAKVYTEKEIKEKKLYAILYPILIELIIYNSVFIFTKDFEFIQMTLLIGFVILTIYEFINKKIISTVLFSEIFILSAILYKISLEMNIGSEYFILIVLTTISIITYIYNEELKKIISYFIPVLLDATITNIILRISYPSLLLPIIGLIFIIYAQIDSKNRKELSLSFEIVNTVFVSGTMLINLITHYRNPLCPLVLSLVSLVFIIIGIFKEEKIYKSIGYISLNFLIVRLFYIINDNSLYVISIPLVTIIITLLNMFIEKSKAKEYLIFQYIISFIFIYFFDVSILSIITISILSFLFYNFGIEKENKLKYLSIISYIPIIYLRGSFLNEYLIFISIAVILILSIIAYQKKNINAYSILSFIYLGFHIIRFDRIYLNFILLIIVSLIHYLSNQGKKKDIFKFGIFIFSYGLIMYYLYNSYMNNINILKTFVSILVLILTTRTILKKYTPNYKVLEYIFLIIINIVSIGSIQSELDAILLIGLFVVGIILGYSIKLGPLLICSLGALLYTVFKLTEQFWLNLSWWIYVLAVGSILIVFAIKNEMKEKNNNEEKKKLLETVRKKFDL